MVPAGATALATVLVGLFLLSQRPLRRLGAGVLGGALFAVVVEAGLLALYFVQLIGD